VSEEITATEAPGKTAARATGLATAFAMLVVDQAHKLWMIDTFDISSRQPVHVLPWLDLVMAWNNGISYSLLQADSATGRYGLLALTLAATLLLAIWMWRAGDRLTTFALGLVVGGALGNAYDRFTYGAVADFFYIHVGSFSWYVFNLADVGIVAGVGLLLYESLFIKEKTVKFV
jgi:signal peptidase II